MSARRDFAQLAVGVLMNEIITKIDDIERLLNKYNIKDFLVVVSECKDLLKKNKRKEFWKIVNSPTWWGRENLSLANVHFAQGRNDDDLPRDMAVYEQALLVLGRSLLKEGIVNEDVEEWVFQLESWYDI